MKTSFRINFESEENLVDRLNVAIMGAMKAKLLKPGEYKVMIETVNPERTTEQNKFYWAILNKIAEDTGNEPDDLHEMFKARFLQDHSTKLVRIKSTTDLSVLEFTQYIEKILAFMATKMGWTMPATREF